MPPAAARLRPAYQSQPPDPLVNPPPWNHTRTGRPSGAGPSAGRRGVHTLRVRQPSSSQSGARAPMTASSRDGPCGTDGPGRLASRNPGHDGGGWGAAKRNSPTGDAAYGMPRNAATPSSATPWTRPDSVSATG